MTTTKTHKNSSDKSFQQSSQPDNGATGSKVINKPKIIFVHTPGPGIRKAELLGYDKTTQMVSVEFVDNREQEFISVKKIALRPDLLDYPKPNMVYKEIDAEKRGIEYKPKPRSKALRILLVKVGGCDGEAVRERKARWIGCNKSGNYLVEYLDNGEQGFINPRQHIIPQFD